MSVLERSHCTTFQKIKKLDIFKVLNDCAIVVNTLSQEFDGQKNVTEVAQEDTWLLLENVVRINARKAQ